MAKISKPLLRLKVDFTRKAHVVCNGFNNNSRTACKHNTRAQVGTRRVVPHIRFHEVCSKVSSFLRPHTSIVLYTARISVAALRCTAKNVQSIFSSLIHARHVVRAKRDINPYRKILSSADLQTERCAIYTAI